MSVLLCIETIIENRFNYNSSSKFSSAAQTLTFRRTFCCSRRFNCSSTVQVAFAWYFVQNIVSKQCTFWSTRECRPNP